MEKNLTTETSNGGRLKVKRQEAKGKKGTSLFTFYFLLFTFFSVSVVNLSCGSKPTDLRTLVPGDSLIYLETNDLGAALQPIVDNKAFEQVAKKKPDLSSLKGVQLAVAVIGFETREEKLTDEHSIGRIQPHFVSIADTHSWNYQAVGFAEQKLGPFVENIYDSTPALEKSDKNGGKYFTWTAKDGRKAYALVIDSLIYFGNDESAIDKCLAVKRGDADSIVKTGKIQQSDPKTLASGYVSTDGIAQIANIVGLKFASETGEDSEVKSAIAGILPQLLRNSITEINWTATKTEQGIEDKYLLSMPFDVANTLNEVLAPGDKPDFSLLEPLGQNTPSVTFYNIKNPQIAWRGLLLTASKQTDPVGGKMLLQFSSLLFEPYGIKDPEVFLKSVGNTIVSATIDSSGEKTLVIGSPVDLEGVRRSVSQDALALNSIRTRVGPDDLGYIFISKRVCIGNAIAAFRCEVTKDVVSDEDPINASYFRDARSVASTLGHDADLSGSIAEVLSEKKSDDIKAETTYFTVTRFTKTGIERRTVSDFGLIGSIIAQLAQD